MANKVPVFTMVNKDGNRWRADGKQGSVVTSAKLAAIPETLKDTGPLWILAVRVIAPICFL